MTVCELINLLKNRPEDAEIIVFDKTLKWTNTIDDTEPLSATEHDEDGTPIIYLYTE